MSDQYTPTTEEVLAHWDRSHTEVGAAALRRWLASVKAEAWDEALQETATWIEGGTSRNYGPEYDSPMDRALIAVIDTLRTAPNPYRKGQTNE